MESSPKRGHPLGDENNIAKKSKEDDNNIPKKPEDDLEQRLKLLKQELEKAYQRNITVGYISNLPNSVVSFAFANNDTKEESVEIDLCNPDLSKLKQLPWKPSPFGFGKERKFDENVRRSKEIRLAFKLGQRHEVQAPRILSHLGQMILDSRKKERKDEETYEWDYSEYKTCHAEIYKMIMYEQGDMFTEHTDTPETDLDMSLVVYLPTEYTGGSLMFNKFDSAISFKPKHINYIIFQPNMPHAVKPVKSGYRLCITYKIYKLNAAKCHHEYRLANVNWPFEKGYFSTSKAPRNTLISCPNVHQLKNLLDEADDNLNYEVVYAPDRTPSIVYTGYEDDDTNAEEWLSNNISEPGDLCTNYESCYKVNHSLYIGYEEHPVTVTYGGNSPCSETMEVCTVFQFLLINPTSFSL